MEGSFLARRDQVEESHIELITLFNSVIAIAIA